MILECCLAGVVDFLITGDKDLLDILDLPFKLNMLTPSEFVKKD
jgi:predicted nucleic acid-binding protein